MKKKFILWLLSVLLLLPIECLAQSTEVWATAKVRGEESPEFLYGVRITISYPASFSFIGFSLIDNGFHNEQSFYDVYSGFPTKIVKLAMVNAGGFKQGLFGKFRFTRTSTAKYSPLTGAPLLEGFKVLEYEILAEDGTFYPADISSITLSKFNWR